MKTVETLNKLINYIFTLSFFQKQNFKKEVNN